VLICSTIDETPEVGEDGTLFFIRAKLAVDFERAFEVILAKDTCNHVFLTEDVLPRFVITLELSLFNNLREFLNANNTVGSLERLYLLPDFIYLT